MVAVVNNQIWVEKVKAPFRMVSQMLSFYRVGNCQRSLMTSTIAMAHWWSDYLDQISVVAEVVPIMKSASR